jgi:hypothetical protein
LQPYFTTTIGPEQAPRDDPELIHAHGKSIGCAPLANFIRPK